jgi:hypothetical protein
VLPEETVWKELSTKLHLHFGTMPSSPSVCRAFFETTMAYKRGGAYFGCVDLMDVIVPLGRQVRKDGTDNFHQSPVGGGGDAPRL